MIVFPNAKINLGLHVLRRRTDGYHDLETVFYPVPFYDILEIVEPDIVTTAGKKSDKRLPASVMREEVLMKSGKKIRFSSSGIQVAGKIEDHLCIKACKIFDDQIGLASDLDMHLHKQIPTGAGLGGGSADASFTLKVLNELNGFKATQTQLLEMALQLGSDCPFFLINKPVIASGRGELMKDVSVNLKGYILVISKPEVHISTSFAFSGITPHERNISLETIVPGPPERWKKNLINDFEKGLLKKFPEIEIALSKLIAQGAVYASLTGSGSAVYGLFESDKINMAALEKLGKIMVL